jgi:tripartite-type tricarboxylate transporter receptor subunit TctC
MKMPLIALALTFIHAIVTAAVAATPDPFPARPIRIVIGFTPGGMPDITARLIGAKLAESWKQQVVVDNRPGAGGVAGARIVAESNPDGYTLLSVSAAHVVSPTVHARMPYDTARDFAGITTTASACYLLVVPPTLGIKSVKDLIALAKAKPGQINFSSGSTGSGTHFAAEIFKSAAGIDVVHVPYKGVPEALTDTMANRVQFFMSPLASAINMVKEGRLIALGVSAEKRVRTQPDIPTIAESGLAGFRWDSWAGLLAPAKTPRVIIHKLNAEITRILRAPEVEQRLNSLGAEPNPGTPAQFDRMIAEQLVIVADIARKSGMQPQ